MLGVVDRYLDFFFFYFLFLCAHYYYIWQVYDGGAFNAADAIMYVCMDFILLDMIAYYRRYIADKLMCTTRAYIQCTSKFLVIS